MKKRILSLILALSMVLSVLPLGAFAEGSLPELVMGANGLPDCSDGSNGNGWRYISGTLYLDEGTYNFSSTHPQNTGAGTRPVPAVRCMIEIRSGVEITGGSFGNSVTNYGTISSGTFQTMGGGVINEGTIKNGTFTGSVTNDNTISGGTFQNGCSVTNGGTISDGTFQNRCIVTNKSIISGGTFQNGCSVTNNKTISGGTFQNGCRVTNYGTINGKGTFEGTVVNNATGDITGGTFQSTCSVTNTGIIKDGIFTIKVENGGIGEIFGGIFAAGLSRNDGNVAGGVFNGNATITGVRGLHSITWDTAYPNAKITKVNDVSADWKPYVVIDGDALPEVIITADTEIFSLNHESISADKYVNGDNDKKTVKFTMPDNDDMVLNGAITHGGDLVMENGYPKVSNGGTISCSGNGWEYKCKSDPISPNTLILGRSSGSYNFSLANPQDTTKTTPADSAVACAIESLATITGGTFAGSVANGYTIENGTFNGSVTNYGTIKGGAFESTCSVINEKAITGGKFECAVTNNARGEIFGGTFKGTVTNNAKIYGGVFNGKTGLDGVTGLHSIAVASGAKIEKVNDVPADWKPYVVVTSNATTNEVTITADTEIFSLNGKPIGTDYNSSYPKPNDRTTVKFTMPDKNVVLNEEINYGDFVMKDGYPEASNGGKTPCWGDGWEYDSSGILILKYGTYDFSSTHPQNISAGTQFAPAVQCAIYIQPSAEITGGTFSATVKNHIGGTIFSGTFDGIVENKGTITGGIFAAGLSKNSGNVTGGVFNGNTALTDARHVTVTDGSLLKVNGEDPRNVDETTGAVTTGTAWDLYSYAGTTVTITADTEIFSLNGQPIGAGNCNSSYGSDKKTVTFTMPDDDVVLNKAITSTDLVMENGWPKDSNGGTIPCKGDGWEYIPNDPTNGDMLLLTGSNQTGGLFDFSTIGDGSAVECNVFVGKPTAITGGEFNGKVFNNSGILGGTFHGEVDNRAPGRIVNGTFYGAVENNGMIENGTFNDAVKNNCTINDGTFHVKVENNGVINSGTFNGKVDNTTMGRIENGTFNDAVENNGTIEKGTFHGAVENNGTINGGVFNGAVTNNGTISGNITGSGTLNGEPITKTEPEPEPEPTTYTVTVIGGTIDGKTSVSAKENDTLTVVLDQSDIPDGMTFDLWSISSSKLSGDINVDYRAEAMTFQMPAEDVTIRAQYRSAEIIEDAAPSPLATAATIAVGGAAAGIVVWQGVSLGVDLYLANALPQGVPVPTDRRALALLLWETAGKPEVALPTLYGDIPTEEIELQKATRWAVQNGLMDAADKKDASFFDPDHYVTKMDVFGAWLRLKKLLGTT